MSNRTNVTNGHQVLQRLARQGPEAHETSMVTSPGARATAWAAKVKSHDSYNVYNVCAVQISDAGSLPVEVGQQMQAFNLAESFLDEGTLSANTYILMCRVGDKNMFYAPV